MRVRVYSVEEIMRNAWPVWMLSAAPSWPVAKASNEMRLTHVRELVAHALVVLEFDWRFSQAESSPSGGTAALRLEKCVN